MENNHKKRRILYLLDTFPKTSSETFVLSEISELIRLGNDVFIVASSRDKIKHDVDNYDISKNIFYTHIIRNTVLKALTFSIRFVIDLFHRPAWVINIAREIYKTHISYKNMTNSYLALRKVIRAKRNGLEINVIHVPFPILKHIETAAFLSKQLKCPFTVTFRAMDIYKNAYKKNRRYRFELARKAGQIITISNYNKEFIEEKIKPVKEIEIIHSAIDIQKFKPYKHVEEPRIITIGRFVEKKGIEYLLKAFGILSARDITFSAVIIGEGEFESQYRSLIKQYNIADRVTIKSPMAQENVIEELKTSMIFVLPCIIAKDEDRDILPNVLKEAMSMEIPVITSNISGIGELIEHNVNGVLVPQKDIDALVDAMSKLLSDRDIRIKLGKNAREMIKKHFNIQNEVKKLNEIFARMALNNG